MEILSLVFAGTATDRREDMARFARDVLGPAPVPTSGVDVDMFALGDGSRFAVAGPRDGAGGTSRELYELVAER